MRAVLLVLLGLPLAVASAATITVDTTADNLVASDGHCTLREAIANVNATGDTTGGDCAPATGGGDTIAFDLTLPATIRLDPTLGELSIIQDASLSGPGAGLLAIDGRGQTRVMHVRASFASISNLTIRNGMVTSPADARGGGVLVDVGATLQMTDCTLVGNRTSSDASDARGGAVEVDGTASFSNCTFSGNVCSRFGYGGAVEIAGLAAFDHCTFKGNKVIDGEGGGIEVSGFALLTDCTFLNNRALDVDGFSVSGGAITISGSASLSGCMIRGNKAIASNLADASGGGITVEGVATLDACTVRENRAVGRNGKDIGSSGAGGGIWIGGRATLTNSTVRDNKAVCGTGNDSYGGGIDNEGTATLINCTLSHNEATGIGGNVFVVGGGIEDDGSTTLINCTLDGNRATKGFNTDGGGGIDLGDATLVNTIVANSGDAGNCSGLAVSGGHNLSTDATCFLSVGTDLVSTPAGLVRRIVDNGGPTQTLALCTGARTPVRSCTGPSPALDGGDDSVTSPNLNLASDQRGLPRLAGAHVDIGAYEAQ